MRQKDALIAEVAALLPEGSFQERPFYPSLLNQPALLFIPEPGKLVAIYFYDFSERITWHTALGALEDLFELKTTVGVNTRVIAIVDIPVLVGQAARDMVHLLENTFDGFIQREREAHPTRVDFLHKISNVGLRDSLFPLWREEANYQRQVLSRDIDGDADALLVSPAIALQGRDPNFRARAKELLRDAFDEPVIEGRLVDSVKSPMGQLSKPYLFKFDFMLPTHPPVVVDIVDGKRHGLRERLRYMMAKARLIRYWMGSDGIRQRQPDYRTLALVSGTLAGPDHDPYRYVRLLRSVGWEIAHENDIAGLHRVLAR